MQLMKTTVSVSTIYKRSLERAFKTPMLSDIGKVHTGFGFTPRVTDTIEDENWGKPGFSKKVFTARNFLKKRGWTSNYAVLERVENTYWKIEIGDFQTYLLGFTKYVGVWKTAELEPNKIAI